MRLNELSDEVISHILRNFSPGTIPETEFVYDSHTRCVLWCSGMPDIIDREEIDNCNGRYVTGIYRELGDMLRSRNIFSLLSRGVTSDNYLG
ncbi:MAG: hypothetical protein AABW79_01045 [Nanoarchaeota archaeon]